MSRFERVWCDFVHLTWSGRATMLWLPIRRLFVQPAPTDERCFMGAPVGDHVWCPRRVADDIFCSRHG